MTLPVITPLDSFGFLVIFPSASGVATGARIFFTSPKTQFFQVHKFKVALCSRYQCNYPLLDMVRCSTHILNREQRRAGCTFSLECKGICRHLQWLPSAFSLSSCLVRCFLCCMAILVHDLTFL